MNSLDNTCREMFWAEAPGLNTWFVQTTFKSHHNEDLLLRFTRAPCWVLRSMQTSIKYIQVHTGSMQEVMKGGKNEQCYVHLFTNSLFCRGLADGNLTGKTKKCFLNICLHEFPRRANAFPLQWMIACTWVLSESQLSKILSENSLTTRVICTSIEWSIHPWVLSLLTSKSILLKTKLWKSPIHNIYPWVWTVQIHSLHQTMWVLDFSMKGNKRRLGASTQMAVTYATCRNYELQMMCGNPQPLPKPMLAVSTSSPWMSGSWTLHLYAGSNGQIKWCHMVWS